MDGSLRIALTCFGALSFLMVCTASVSTTSSENENVIPVDNSNLIQTNSGPVAGIKSVTSTGQTVNIYLGIPYAEPPIGELRFQPPRMVTPWTSTLQAFRSPPVCYQDITQDFQRVKEVRIAARRPWSEDCLVLNIWTPDPTPENAKVLVYIHGGAYIMGAAIIDGTTLALEGVIVVSMNYRLGVFGFLGFGQPDAPGNLGLMDQNLALQWVQNNIEAFGGDPHEVTLLGLSAGSGSVGLHLLSPMSKGLFRRSFMMSGTPTNWWSMREPEDTVARSKKLAEELGCSTQNVTEALACLRTKDPEDILDETRFKSLFDMDHFIPTVDGSFIVEHPTISVAAGRFHPGEAIIGTTSDEGSVFLITRNPGILRTKDGRIRRKDFSKFIKSYHKGLTDLQVEVLNTVYTDWTNPADPIMLRDAARNIFSDGLFNCDANRWADSLAKSGGAVYRYVYDHKYKFKYASSAPNWLGVGHGADNQPLFGIHAMLQYLSPPDRKFNEMFVKHLVNYISTGNPNLSAEEFPDVPEWPQYTTANQEYRTMAGEFSTGNHLRVRECAAWTKLLPILENM